MALLTHIGIFQVIMHQYVCMHVYENTTKDRNLRPTSKNFSFENFQVKNYLETQFENSTEKNNITKTIKTNTTHNQQMPWKPEEPEKELPFAIIVAGPTAAFIVIVFLCVAFYFHNEQLNKNAQKISLTLYVAPDDNTEPGKDDVITTLPLQKVNQPQIPIVSSSLSTSPSSARLSRNLSTVSVRMSRDNSFQTVRLTRDPSSQHIRLAKDSDLLMTPKKSIVSLGLPSRGSIISAFADQEIVNQSSKRKHSIFFI